MPNRSSSPFRPRWTNPPSPDAHTRMAPLAATPTYRILVVWVWGGVGVFGVTETLLCYEKGFPCYSHWVARPRAARPRTVYVPVRFTEQEAEALDTARKSTSRSAYIRLRVLGG